MREATCLMEIRHRYGSLTPAEKRVADYILQNGETVVRMSIQQLAEACGVAKSAVLRCCRALGFSGYPLLKLSLSAELAKNSSLNFSPYIDPADNASSILDKIFSANVKTLHDTAERIDRAALAAVIHAMESAGCIYIYGIGTSAALCGDFQYRITQVGKTALCFTDVPSMKVSTLNIRPGDLAMGISHSGRTMATVDCLKLARQQGAVTACLTSYPDSPVTAVCDHPIAVYSDEIRYPIEAISARIAHISVLDALTVGLSARDYKEAARRARLSREYIETIRLP